MLKQYVIPLALVFSCAAQATAHNDWYAGARIGGVSYDDYISSIDIDDNDWGGGVFLGYKYLPWFAVEAGYTYLGEAEFENISGDYSAQGIDLVGKFTADINEQFNVFGKLGGFIYDAEASMPGGSEDETGLSATAGVGLEYFFQNNLSTRFEYQYYHEVGDSNTGEPNIHFYGLSLVYHWGASPAPVALIEPEPAPEPMPVVEAMPEPAPVPKVVKIGPLSETFPFAFDSNTLSQAQIERMQPIIQRLTDYPQAMLYVVGHTDSRGSEEYNQKLGQERAQAVAEVLTNHFAIDSSRVEIKGLGELQPVATNETEEGRAQNRRVEVFTPGFELPQAQ